MYGSVVYIPIDVIFPQKVSVVLLQPAKLASSAVPSCILPTSNVCGYCAWSLVSSFTGSVLYCSPWLLAAAGPSSSSDLVRGPKLEELLGIKKSLLICSEPTRSWSRV